MGAAKTAKCGKNPSVFARMEYFSYLCGGNVLCIRCKVMEANVYTIVLAAIAPAIVLLVYIWWRDKYQREPFGQIVKGFCYGVLSALLAVLLESLLMMTGMVTASAETFGQALVNAFVGAAMPEELAKLLFLWLLLRRNKYFDERFDGIVYAVCVGLGFAATENIVYLFSHLNTWETVAVQRAIFAVPGHFFFAVAMGYFYSMIYFGDMDWKKASLIFWVPVLLHGTYDGLLFVANLGTMLSGAMLMAFYYFCYKLMGYGRRNIAEHLERDRKDPNQVAYWKEHGSAMPDDVVGDA